MARILGGFLEAPRWAFALSHCAEAPNGINFARPRQAQSGPSFRWEIYMGHRPLRVSAYIEAGKQARCCRNIEKPALMGGAHQTAHSDQQKSDRFQGLVFNGANRTGLRSGSHKW
jgi:hypothetical protein